MFIRVKGGGVMKDLSIKNKVRISYAILTTFVVLNAVLSIFFVTSISNSIDDLYNHPFTVTSAIRNVEISTYEQLSLVNDLVISEPTQTQQILLQLESKDQTSHDGIDVLYDKYLGDMNDVVNIEEEYLIFYNEVKSVYQDYLDSDLISAKQSLETLNDDSIDSLMLKLSGLKAFADNKAVEFSEEADSIRDSYIITITITSIGMVLAAIGLFMMMIKDIFPAILKLTDTINSFKKGEDKNTLDLDRKDEIGFIGHSLNEMIDNIKTQNEIDSLNLKLSSLRDRENLRITLMSIGDGVITTDLEGVITNVNPVALKLLGSEQENVIGSQITDVMNIVNKNSRRKISNPITRAIRRNTKVTMENNSLLLSNDGKEYDISDSASPITDEKGKTYGAVLVFRDITEEVEIQQEVEYLSFHDRLTGIYNRNYLEKKFLELENSNVKDVAVIMGDVNGLKITNDAFGHKFGDLLLQDISAILMESSPKDDTTIVRWGGDEFVLIIENTNEKRAEQISRKIIEVCDAFESSSPVKPSISIGYAVKINNDQNLYRTLIRAEDMMYENKLLQKDSLRSAIVSSLQTSLFEKSYETEEHANRVSEYSEIIANELGLLANEINSVVLLSRLHDIGKISIDDDVLLKPGKLDADEWKAIKKHPETGYRIASSLNELTHIAEGILSHHEYYDGNGYPRGLQGEDIPLQARIVAVADAYDVMTSDRAYKKAMKKEKAIEELLRCRGTQFDPNIIDIFVEQLKKAKN